MSAAVPGKLTDRSGTIAVLNVSQQVMAGHGTRKYLLFHNASDTAMWINFGAAASVGQGSIQVAPGATFEMRGTFVSVQSVNVICTLAAKAYTAKEG